MEHDDRPPDHRVVAEILSVGHNMQQQLGLRELLATSRLGISCVKVTTDWANRGTLQDSNLDHNGGVFCNETE